MEKKEILFGIANGIFLFLVSFLLALVAGALGFLAVPAILAIEYVALKKKLGPLFYATSLIVSIIIINLAYHALFPVY